MQNYFVEQKLPALYGHAFTKYTEFALSGVPIIGDIPAEWEDEYRRNLHEYDR
jgi:hypothetical protein